MYEALALFLVMSMALLGLTSVPVDAAGDADTWSKPVDGLQARIVLVERSRINGTRTLAPYLELRNASDSAEPLRVRSGAGHVRFELVGENGKPVRGGWALPRSGPHPDPGTIVLPFDSAIRIGMYCSNWGVPRDAQAMIATDSGAWVILPQEKGKVFLRAFVKGDAVEADPHRTWHGTIETPPVKIDWQE
jgi:hypothetical protein